MNASGRIRIIKVPSGGAPEWVRRSWFDLVLPCHPIMGFPKNGEPEKDSLTGKEVRYDRSNRLSVSVPQEEAILILSETEKSAAKWWRDQGFPKPAPNDCFSFGEDEVEIISGVSQQKTEQHLGILEVGR